MLTAIDQRPWTVPVGVVAVAGIAATIWPVAFGVPISFTDGPLRQQVYSSLAGSSSSLLGFLIAAVTILAAFGKRPTSNPADQARESALAIARTKLVVVLLTAAVCMLAVLVAATLALASANFPGRLYLLDGILLAGTSAGVSGIILGGLGLGFAVAERAN